MQQLDLDLGLALKARGMTTAEANGSDWLTEVLRPIARMLATRIPSRELCADDVSYYLLCNDIEVPKGPFWGSLFKTKDWVFTGKRRPSALPSNHGRELKVWRLI